jgi:hypothetical protein
MSYYDDEYPEPNEEEMSLHMNITEAAAKNEPVQFVMPDWIVESVVKHAAKLALSGMRDEAKRAVKDAVDGAVAEAANEYVREKVTPLIDATIKEGWQATDSYGRPTKRVTVESIVIEQLTQSDSYDRTTWIHAQVKKHLATMIDAAMKSEVDAARAELRKQLDAVLKAKISETIRDAVGLK